MFVAGDSVQFDEGASRLITKLIDNLPQFVAKRNLLAQMICGTWTWRAECPSGRKGRSCAKPRQRLVMIDHGSFLRLFFGFDFDFGFWRMWHVPPSHLQRMFSSSWNLKLGTCLAYPLLMAAPR